MKRFNSEEDAFEWLEDNGYSDNPGWREFTKALVGVTTDDRLVYSYEGIVECLMETDDMSDEDARDIVDYNVVGSLNPHLEQSPIILHEI